MKGGYVFIYGVVNGEIIVKVFNCEMVVKFCGIIVVFVSKVDGIVYVNGYVNFV